MFSSPLLLCHLLPIKGKYMSSHSVKSLIIQWHSKRRPRQVELMWGSAQHYGAKCRCVFSCLWVYGSIRGREQPIARACLFPLAIFSYWPCQGPHIHPPTVGSSGLRYNGPWQTTVINPCHLFIQPLKNTCSPLMLPAVPNMLQIHNPGKVVCYLVVPLAFVMAPWGSPARPDFVSCLLNPASKPTIISSSISLYLFSLATAINQMASKPPLKQIHTQMLLCPQYWGCSL